jgi:hypothetical protein
MNIRVSIDGKAFRTISLGRFILEMWDLHPLLTVHAMIADLEGGRTVRDGGGAAPIFEYVPVAPAAAVRR